MSRSIGLDIARVMAIGLVIVSHFAKKLEFLGVFGVELFFALSGFLIGNILYKALMRSPRWCMDDVLNFWLRRWFRTLPNYFLFLVVALVFHAYFGGLPSPTFFLTYLVFAQNLLSGDNSFYGVSWSLAVEEWFYLLFPLVILLLTLAGYGRRVAFIGTTLVFLLLPPLLREFEFTTTAPEAVRLMTLPRLDAIFYGVAVAFFVARRAPGKPLRAAGALIGLAVFASFLYLYARSADPGPLYRAAFFALPISFAISLPWLQQIHGLPRQLRALTRPITLISLWSYSIYLSHIPVLFTVYELFGRWRDNPWVNLLSKFVGLAICIVISRFVYMYFETRFTAMRPPERRVGAAVGQRALP